MTTDTHLLDRVRPPVPSKSQRYVPKGGFVVAGRHIPEKCMVSIPFQVIMRDSRYFSPSPNQWRPDRWLKSEKEKAMNKTAWLPFSTGHYSCVGRHFALIELRIVLANFALNFDGEIAPGHDNDAFEKSILDRFTVQNGALMVRLKKRKV